MLCEKPLAVTYPDAKRMVAAAKKAGVINMVNLSYRDWPAIQAVEAIVRSGEIGEVRHVEDELPAGLAGQQDLGRLAHDACLALAFSEKHGSGGVLGDVGVYIVDFATFLPGRSPRSTAA